MSDKTAEALISAAWNLLVLGTCCYVVFGLNRSGWWFALALVLLV